MICGLVVTCLILGLLCLINNAATNALFSLFVASNYLSWGMPILCRVIWGEKKFQPGEFYTGRFSRPTAYIAVVYLLFGVILSMFPTTGPDPSCTYSPLSWFFRTIYNDWIRAASDMNYTVVINSFVWIGCMAYYFLFARHWFTGPRMTVDESRSTDADSTFVTPVIDGSHITKKE